MLTDDLKQGESGQDKILTIFINLCRIAVDCMS